MVSTFISSVPRVRSRPGRAALMAKFMAASSRRACTPACTMPWGLQATSAGTKVPSTHPRSSPSTPYRSKEPPTWPMSGMPPSPSQRSMSLIRGAISRTVAPGWVTVATAGSLRNLTARSTSSP